MKKIQSIEDIADYMIGSTVEECQIGYETNSFILFLDSGMSVEIIADSIYADIPKK